MHACSRRTSTRQGSPVYPLRKRELEGLREFWRREEACRIVPSPPKVATRSVFWRMLLAEGLLVSTAKTFCAANVFWRSEARVGSARNEIRGYVDATCLLVVSCPVTLSACSYQLDKLYNGILSGRRAFFLEQEDVLKWRGPA